MFLSTFSIYLIIVLVQLPWLFLAAGAFIRLRKGGGRLRRLQMEGAGLVFLANLARWAVFDPNFGWSSPKYDAWTTWFARGELGLFSIGLLLFALGYFLERPAYSPAYAVIGKSAAALSILGGAIFGLYAYNTVSLPWLGLPWHVGRCIFMLGFLPFAAGYLAFSPKLPWRETPIFKGQD